MKAKYFANQIISMSEDIKAYLQQINDYKNKKGIAYKISPLYRSHEEFHGYMSSSNKNHMLVFFDKNMVPHFSTLKQDNPQKHYYTMNVYEYDKKSDKHELMNKNVADAWFSFTVDKNADGTLSDNNSNQVGLIYVHDGYRGKGIGSSILSMIEYYSTNKGAVKQVGIATDVFMINPIHELKQFYNKSNFETLPLRRLNGLISTNEYLIKKDKNLNDFKDLADNMLVFKNEYLNLLIKLPEKVNKKEVNSILNDYKQDMAISM